MKIKKFVKLGLLTLPFLFFGCGNNSDTIKVGTSADFAPYEYIEDGKIVGIEMDLIKKIGENLGKKVDIQNMDFDGVLTATASGKVDLGIAGISVTDERKKSMDFSDEIFKNDVRILQKNSTNYEGPKDLENKKVGFQIGTTSQDYLNENIKSAEQKGYKDYVQALNDLENNKIDAIIMDQIPAERMLKEKTGYKLSNNILYSDVYSISTKKGANQELISKINEELKKLKTSGEYENIVTKYYK